MALLPRLDVATLAAAGALVERRVSVWWPEEAAWFAGTVVAFDAASGRHTVRLAQCQPCCDMRMHACRT